MAERSLRVDAVFDDDGTDEARPDAVAYAFDERGRLVTRTRLAEGSATLPMRKDAKLLRVFVGPDVPGKDVDLAAVRRAGAREAVVERGVASLTIPAHAWRGWLRCRCLVRGRVVKRVEFPDGDVRLLPVCNTRVSIYEVDPLPWLIYRMPEHLLWRLRDELVEVVGPPLPTAEPHRAPLPMSAEHQAALPLSKSIEPLTTVTDAAELRALLPSHAAALKPLLWRWSWLDALFRHRTDLLRTVETDENGEFSAVIGYPCFGDRPDVYVTAEQLRDGVWHSVYRPSIRSSTRWNYACGTQLTLEVTDPAAVVCFPEEVVEPPAGVNGAWVAPLAVGGAWVGGSAGAAQHGWVKPDGHIDYHSFTGAPFGGDLAFRLAYDGLPTAGGVTHYRFSYRRVGDPDWTAMTRPVTRYYIKQSSEGTVSLGAYALGPKVVGPSTALYEFRPAAPPEGWWPPESYLGDIYHAFLDTQSLPGGPQSSGDYEVRVELFNAGGNRVTPGAAFRFLFPASVSPSLVTTRLAAAAEIVDDGVVFPLRVDNRRCRAVIANQTVGGASADDCGVLHYGASANVGLRFTAAHDGGHASFRHWVLRKDTTVHSVSGLVTTSPVGPFTLAGGWYSGTLPDATVRGGCPIAALAEHVYVTAHATTGWARIDAYDASAEMAFALVP